MIRGKCKTCQARFLAKLKSYNDPKIVVDFRYVIYWCEVPVYINNIYGKPAVQIWDCDAQKVREYPEKEYKKMQARGEI